jgi:hypothetical protein
MLVYYIYGHLEYIAAIWYILWPFGIHILWPFGNSVVIRYTFPRFGILCHEKSGNPETYLLFFRFHFPRFFLRLKKWTKRKAALAKQSL